MDQAQLIGIALGLGILGLLLLIIFFKANIVLCQPNELVIIAGRERTLEDGTRVGYRVFRGGRGFKWPMIESVARLSLSSVPIELTLTKTMCEGMIPVTVESRATVKIAGEQHEGMDAAIERFLGKGPDAVIKTSKQAIEGALRGIIATMSPAQANANRLELAAKTADLARKDLKHLGLVLDFIQIQEITDDQGYLEAIGRKQNATVQKEAKIAEATADAEARQVAAEQKRSGREAEITAELKIVEYENNLAIKRADLNAELNRSEQRASVAGKIARVEKEIELEAKRGEWNEHRQNADTIVPARANRLAQILEAEGEASRIKENGKATAEAIALMKEQWEDGETRDLFLIQLYPELLEKVTNVVSDNLQIDRLTILDGGDGEGLPTYMKNLTKSAVAILEQVKNATGIDLAEIANSNREGKAANIPKELN